MNDSRCYQPKPTSLTPVLRRYNVALSDGEPYTKNTCSVTVEATSTEHALSMALEKKGQQFTGAIEATISVHVKIKVKAIRVDWAEVGADGVEVTPPVATRTPRSIDDSYRDHLEGNRG